VKNCLQQIAPQRANVTISSATSKRDRYRRLRVVDLNVFKTWMADNDLDLDLDDALGTLSKVRTLK
jgi:hypothetical protein